MICKLINKIHDNLEVGLVDVLPDDGYDHIVVEKDSVPVVENYPLISIYPEKFEMISKIKDKNLIGEGILSAQREFSQKLSVKIFAADYDDISKLASLISGIILINKEQLIQLTNAELANTSNIYSVKLIINDLELENGNPQYENQNAVDDSYQLSFWVKGYMSIQKTITEGYEKISEVIVNNN